MRLSGRVESIHRDFPVDWTLRVLERLCAFDRYQASEGIEGAADVVAAAAEEAGLREVSTTFYDVTQGLKWWSFDSPRPWTPIAATLRIGDTVVAFPQDRMSLATYSVPCTTPTDFPLCWMDNTTEVRGAIAVLSPSIPNVRETITWLEQAGAAGVIVQGQRGRARIELQSGTRLFGFSVLPEELMEIERAAREGQRASVCIDVRRTGRMPVVQGLLPATKGGPSRGPEILVQAHLCHPGPGANDNASGIAGALGIARVLGARESSRDRAIRFVFAPEFVGTTAYLHDFPRPIEAVINLDMLGEDPAQCGSGLIVERPPDHVPSPLGALAERCLELLPAKRKSYSGAVPMPEGQWFATPFTGASDHGVFADRKVAVPAVQLSHFPDRFNHTSSDSLDKVCPQELRRAAAVAATCAEVLSSLTAEDREALARLAAFAGAREIAALCQREPEPDTSGTVNPYAADELPMLVDHVLQVGKQQIASTHATTAAQLSAWLDNLAQAHRSVMRSCADNVRPGKEANTRVRNEWQRTVNAPACDEQDDRCMPGERRGGARKRAGKGVEGERQCMQALWSGPFNLRGLAAALPIEQRHAALGHFPRLMSLALAIDGESGREAIIRRAAYSSRLPIRVDEAHAFLDALVRAGWARE